MVFWFYGLPTKKINLKIHTPKKNLPKGFLFFEDDKIAFCTEYMTLHSRRYVWSCDEIQNISYYTPAHIALRISNGRTFEIISSYVEYIVSMINKQNVIPPRSSQFLMGIWYNYYKVN